MLTFNKTALYPSGAVIFLKIKQILNSDNIPTPFHTLHGFVAFVYLKKEDLRIKIVNLSGSPCIERVFIVFIVIRAKKIRENPLNDINDIK